MYSVMTSLGPGPGPWRRFPLRRLRRRHRKMPAAIRAIRTATPLIVPPTMAPVRSGERFELAVAGGAAVDFSVGNVVCVGSVDVLDSEELDELCVELLRVLLEVLLVELLVVVLAVLLSLLLLLLLLLLSDTVFARGVSLKLIVKLGRSIVAEMPLALANTVAAMELADPQPNWKKPPSNSFR